MCILYVWQRTGQTHANTHRLFASMWRPLVSVIPYNTIIQCCMCACCFTEMYKEYLTKITVWASSSSPTKATFVPHFFRGLVAEQAHGAKLRTQSLTHSLTHPAYLMPRERKDCTLEKQHLTITIYDMHPFSRSANALLTYTGQKTRDPMQNTSLISGSTEQPLQWHQRWSWKACEDGTDIISTNSMDMDIVYAQQYINIVYSIYFSFSNV